MCKGWLLVCTLFVWCSAATVELFLAAVALRRKNYALIRCETVKAHRWIVAAS